MKLSPEWRAAIREIFALVQEASDVMECRRAARLRDRRRTVNNQWQRDNRERRNAAARARYAANNAKGLQKSARYRAAHPERVAAASKAWKAKNPMYWFDQQAARRRNKTPRPSPGSRLRSHTNDRQDLGAKDTSVTPAGQL